jgi:hypothetical protein
MVLKNLFPLSQKTLRLHYRDQLVDGLGENIDSVLRESYETHKYIVDRTESF